MKNNLLRYIIVIKAFIYRRTGIYLAHKEELEYLTSTAFWKAFQKIVSDPNRDMGLRDVQSVLIGSWQLDNGFYRTL